MYSFDVHLKLKLSADGKLESIEHQPFIEEPKNMPSLNLYQNCPGCCQQICLNIVVDSTLQQYVESPNIYSHAMKEEISAVDVMEIKVENTECYFKEDDDEVDEVEMPPPRKKKQLSVDGHPCQICGEIFDSKSKLAKHKPYCLDEVIICSACVDQKSFTSRPGYYEHCRELHDGQFACHACEPAIMFTDPLLWYHHMLAHKRRDQGEMHCSECDKKFLQYAEYRTHVEDHYKGAMICRFCEETFKFRSDFRQHLLDAHQYPDFPCPYCDKEYDTDKLLNLHLINKHWSVKSFCKSCRKAFEDVNERDEHALSCQLSPKQAGPVGPCKNCGKKFRSRDKLSQHRQLCLAEALICFQCPEQPSFMDRPDFYEHCSEQHMGMLQCHHCTPPEFFHDRLKWLNHMQGHTKNHVCRYCQKEFAFLKDLAPHEDSHYKGNMICAHCGASFSLRPEFKEHMETFHTGSTFKCAHCETKTFDTEKQLNLHMLNAHWKTKRSKCKLCHMEFSTVGEKKAHLADCSGQYKTQKHEPFTPLKRESYGKPVPEETVCNQCDDRKIFSQRSAFHEHTLKHHDGKYLCIVCEPQELIDGRARWLNHETAHKRVNDGQGYECQKCQQKFLYGRDFTAHKEDHYKGEMMCRFCNDPFEFRSKFIEHLTMVHNCPNFPCPFCVYPKEFDTEYKLNLHAITVHWSRRHLVCAYCSEEFKTIEEKDSHAATCVTTNATCKLCNEIFLHKMKLEKHMKAVHEINRTTYLCHICSKSFPNMKFYKQHIERHATQSQLYECHYCARKLQSKKAILMHIQRLHYPKEFCVAVCDICGEKFATGELLLAHKRKHVENQGCKCDVCGKDLKNKNYLMIHMKRMHSEEGNLKKFQCPHCPFATSMKNYLKVHVLQHLSDKDKPFQCRFCKKGFINKNLGLRHERMHTNERPHACDTCGKTFRHKSDLVAHGRLHTGVKPYECSVCQKRFSDRGCHRSHMLKHEKEMNVTLDKSVRKKKVFLDQ